jgi:hypothetical protein
LETFDVFSPMRPATAAATTLYRASQAAVATLNENSDDTQPSQPVARLLSVDSAGSDLAAARAEHEKMQQEVAKSAAAAAAAAATESSAAAHPTAASMSIVVTPAAASLTPVSPVNRLRVIVPEDSSSTASRPKSVFKRAKSEAELEAEEQEDEGGEDDFFLSAPDTPTFGALSPAALAAPTLTALASIQDALASGAGDAMAAAASVRAASGATGANGEPAEEEEEVSDAESSSSSSDSDDSDDYGDASTWAVNIASGGAVAAAAAAAAAGENGSTVMSPLSFTRSTRSHRGTKTMQIKTGAEVGPIETPEQEAARKLAELAKRKIRSAAVFWHPTMGLQRRASTDAPADAAAAAVAVGVGGGTGAPWSPTAAATAAVATPTAAAKPRCGLGHRSFFRATAAADYATHSICVLRFPCPCVRVGCCLRCTSPFERVR